MRSVDAIYLVEHIARELDVACIVQHLAWKRHGLRIEILPAQTSDAYATRNLRTRQGIWRRWSVSSAPGRSGPS